MSALSRTRHAPLLPATVCWSISKWKPLLLPWTNVTSRRRSSGAVADGQPLPPIEPWCSCFTVEAALPAPTISTHPSRTENCPAPSQFATSPAADGANTPVTSTLPLRGDAFQTLSVVVPDGTCSVSVPAPVLTRPASPCANAILKSLNIRSPTMSNMHGSSPSSVTGRRTAAASPV